MANSPRIAVIGAGLGGLAAAALLQRSGHNVQVYERSPEFRRIGAGIHLGPNVMRVLMRMGVGPRLVETGVEPDAWVIRSADTGEQLFSFPLRGVSEQRYGAPYLTVHRGDLHELMTKAVDPAAIRFGKKLEGLEETGSGVRLSFADGTTASAEIVIGADGVYSKVRDTLHGPELPTYTGIVGHRMIFPTTALDDLKLGDYTRWWAPDRNIIVYYLTKKRDEIYVVTGAPHPDWEAGRSWMPCSKDEYRSVFEAFPADAQRIVEAAPEDGITKWAFFERDPLPYWSDGRVVLLGDACHPMKPHMGQGAAMAMEDAAMLARCLDAVGIEDYRKAFRLYEANRHPRATQVQTTSKSNQWLRDGSDPAWLYGYDVFSVPLVPAEAA